MSISSASEPESLLNTFTSSDSRKRKIAMKAMPRLSEI